MNEDVKLPAWLGYVINFGLSACIAMYMQNGWKDILIYTVIGFAVMNAMDAIFMIVREKMSKDKK